MTEQNFGMMFAQLPLDEQKELIKRLYTDGNLIIMNINNINGTRDFIIIDHEHENIFTGSTQSTMISYYDFTHIETIKTKKELKRITENHLNDGYTNRGKI